MSVYFPENHFVAAAVMIMAVQIEVLTNHKIEQLARHTNTSNTRQYYASKHTQSTPPQTPPIMEIVLFPESLLPDREHTRSSQ